jgi:hypothetical protein
LIERDPFAKTECVFMSLLLTGVVVAFFMHCTIDLRAQPALRVR